MILVAQYTIAEVSQLRRNRILYTHRTRGRGAEGAHVEGLVSGFRLLGFAVEVVSPADEAGAIGAGKSSIWTNFKRRLVDSTRDMPEPMFELLEVLYNLTLALRLTGCLLRHGRPAFIYERYALFTFSGVLFAKLFGLSHVIEINDSALVDRVRPLRFRWMAERIERWTLATSSLVIVVSGQLEKLLTQSYPRLPSVMVHPNAINPSLFPIDGRAAHRSTVRKELGLGAAFVVCFVGSFVPWHRVEEFVARALERMESDELDIRILLVGDGPRLEMTKSAAESHKLGSRVSFVGRKAHAEVSAFIAAADIGIVPGSNDYGSPMKIFEFMAMGVPTIAPDYPPVREVLEDNVTGWLFPKENIAEAVELLAHLSTDPVSVRNAGTKARSVVMRNHQWVHRAEAVVQKIGAA